jgi:murein DD-endopeptidase MepM/ murein hydrolase activator NlpD
MGGWLMTITLNRNPLPGRDLSAPFARVTLGNGDLFTWGDGYLQSVEVELSEGENASNCRFTIYDPGSIFADKYFSYIYEVKGLTPLETPQSSSSSSSSTSNTSSGSTATGSYSVNVKAFLDFIAWAEGTDALNGYATIVGQTIPTGSRKISSYADHPRGDLKFGSDAAGRYQFISTTWDGIKKQLGLTDFSPQNQDRAAVENIRQFNALSDVEAGNWQSAINKLAGQWDSFPGAGNPKTDMAGAISWLNNRVNSLKNGGQSQQTAQDSVQQTTNPPQSVPPQSKSYSGSQITIELGFNGQLLMASSFIHTSLEYDLFGPNTLTFGGQSAVWVLAQRRKNTAYNNLTFKQIAQKIAASYGLKLNMSESGPKYEYFSQRGQTDYEALLIEARRLGFRIYCKGNTLFIQSRSSTKNAPVLELGDNMGLTFRVRHTAEGEAGDGSQLIAGERKVIVDPATGVQKVIRPENPIGIGASSDKAVSGKAIAKNAPKTTGETDQADRVRRENIAGLGGIVADFDAPTTAEFLLIDPDTPFITKGISNFLDRYSNFLDRYWIIASISHRLDVRSGFNSSGTLYSPLKPRKTNSTPTNSNSSNAGIPPLNPNGLIKPTTGVFTSGFRTAQRPGHQGIDIADQEGSPVWAAADGVVADAENSCVIGDSGCGGGYGNLVFINHANGLQTRYAHLQKGSVTVSVGQQVKQGQIIGRQSDTGSSRGTHLHWEVRENGNPVDPLKYVKL